MNDTELCNCEAGVTIISDGKLLVYGLCGMLFLGLVSTFGHGLVARTVIHHITLNYTPYHLLVNLGICDVGFSLCSFFLGLLAVILKESVLMQCAHFLGRLTFISSMFTSSCLAFDRVLALNPETYQMLARKKLSALMIAFSWVLSLAICAVLALYRRIFHLYNTGDVPVGKTSHLAIVTVVLTSLLFIATSIIYAKIKTQMKLCLLKKTNGYLHGKNAEHFHTLKRRQKLNSDITFVSLFTMAMLLPAMCLYLKIYISPSKIDSKLLLFNWCFGALYCAINPFVYLTSMRKLRRMFAIDMAHIRRMVTGKRRQANR